MASSAVISPRSIPRSVTSRISSARGIFRSTRLRLTRSMMLGAAAMDVFIARLPEPDAARPLHRSRGNDKQRDRRRA